MGPSPEGVFPFLPMFNPFGDGVKPYAEYAIELMKRTT
jgi:hypothetical protein